MKNTRNIPDDNVQQLAIAVLMQSVEDAKRGDVQAKKFLEDENGTNMLQYWTDLAKVDKEAIIRGAKTLQSDCFKKKRVV